MKSIVAVRSISGATTNAMKHHVMGCLEDESPDTVWLYHGTNDLRSEESAEKIASNIINEAVSAKNTKTTIYVSGLTARNEKYDAKGKDINKILKKNCNDKNLSFIDNGNINPRMLNKSRLYLNEYGTTQLVNNFCCTMKKWRNKICLGKDFKRKKNCVGSKKVKNICLNSSAANTGRPIISKTNCLEENLNDTNRSFENNKECSNAFQSVQKHRVQNPKNIVIDDLNVNSLRNLLEAVAEIVQNKVDICFLSETKIDEIFPNQQFMISGYKLFRRDGNSHGGDILCYINENIPSKTVNAEGIEKDCEIVLIEFSIKTSKWSCIGLYKPPSQNENNFLYNLTLLINKLTCQYENFILIGDFNMTIENKNLEIFMNLFGLKCLNKKPTCFQSKNPSCISLILTNKKYLFKNSNVLEVGISHHYSFIITALKS